MDTLENNNEQKLTREFKLTSLALTNKNTVFLVILIISVFGAISYFSLPKELFPEINIPTIFVQTTYPGNSPEDIENLISRPIEKEIKTVKGINKLKSTSAQDASMIFVEFTANTDIEEALQEVKDAVDKAKSELPNDLLFEPLVMDLDLSEFPIMYINLFGDYSINELKEYAEYLEEEIEKVYEISKVEISGIDEKEIQINVDLHKLDANNLSFYDIENAVARENVSISGGSIRMGDIRRSIRTIGEFKNIKDIENIIVKHESGNIVYLKDIAEVVSAFEEPKSFARLNRKSVVSLQIIKKSGENLLGATDQVFEILKNSKKNGDIPEDLDFTITFDQSKEIRSQLSNLVNSMVMGVIFVVLVLFFFLGIRNALFVGIAIPMSMLLSFAVFGVMDMTISIIVLFSLILALGMLVDNAIVVVENIYRYVDQGYEVKMAAKYAVGEIAWPIISSTATTLAAFFPLVFWEGMIGEFMKIMPITLIIVLTSSLFVALVITPVMASTFIKKEDKKDVTSKKKWIVIGAMLLIAIVLYIIKLFSFANFIVIFAILGIMHITFLERAAQWFQNKFLVWLENFYLRVIQYTLRRNRPYLFLVGTFFLMFLTFLFFDLRQPQIVFFPENEPQYVNVITEMPMGTDVTVTDSMITIIENDVSNVLKPYADIVESIQTTVGQGVGRMNEPVIGNTPNKGLIAIKFVDFVERKGILTSNVMKEISNELLGKYPGIDFFVEKNEDGPPTGSPINIEISGDDIDKLIAYSDTIENHIINAKIDGIEKLKIDINIGNPELLVNIDRDKAQRFGLSTAQIASTLRTSLFGKEISDLKVGEDEYPIQLRLAEKYRNSMSSLLDQTISFRNNKGKLLQIPISSVATISYSTSYGSIKRKDMNRVITLHSGVIEGYNANEINDQIRVELSDYEMEKGYEFNFTGEQEEQEKTMIFLVTALAFAISIILTILVSQFNSLIKPLIIIGGVVFSTIGVFGGIATFKMPFVVIMSGIGIISLAGIVVNNGIVLVDYIDFLKLNRKKELGISEEDNLTIDEVVNCIVHGGKTRLRPVLLTAITTILGLLPMAVGMNINFETMLSDFNPDIYFGGDNAIFWGPMAWTVIFGLTFSTFLTLVIIPVMYLLANKLKLWFVNTSPKEKAAHLSKVVKRNTKNESKN